MRHRYFAAAVLLGIFFIMVFALLSTPTVRKRSAPQNRARGEEKALKHGKSFAEKEEGKKADRPDLFAEFHRGIRTRDGEAEPSYPMNYKIKELLKARKLASTQALSKPSSAPLNWLERGPGNVAGRTRGIIVDPGDPTFNTWYLGSVSGGVWKTADAGRTWQELTAGLANLATSALAMAASNPNVIYAGTGEGFGNLDQISGNGVWKSRDRGQTWQQLASTVNNNFRNITRVVVDHQNENVVLVSTASGLFSEGSNAIFRSTDGGQNWTKVYDAGGQAVEQIVANPQNFKTQFATVNGVGVIKSTNGGVTWNSASSGLSGGRFELAMAPTDTSRLYISAEGEPANLYISSDAGNTWALAKPLDSQTIDFLGGQGWYDNTIAVHPYNKDRVFVGGVAIWQFEMRPGTSTQRTVLGVDFENTAAFLQWVNSSGQLAGGGISINPAIAVNDQPSLELRFGPGKSQKAHRFTVPAGSTSGVQATSYTYRDYVDVPFEVWDIDNNRQLMVSFRDQLADGVFNLDADLDRSREYIFPQLVPYATTPSSDIAKTAGHTFNQLYLMWATLPAGTTWNPNLPNATLRIRWGNLTTQNVMRNVFVDVYERFGGSSKGVHPDQHNLVFIPTNPAQQQFRLLNANDGGLSYSDDGGATFKQTGFSFVPGFANTLKGYNTSQFYGLDKMNGGDRYIGGTQDNGSFFSPDNPDAASEWKEAPSGDGFEAVWHYRDPNKMLESSYYNDINRSLDGGQSWSNVSPPQGNGPFLTKIARSKQDADLVFATSDVGLWRSDNFASTWTLIQMPQGFVGNSSFAQVKISLASPQVVWAGHAMTATLAPFVSTDGGQTFNRTNSYSESLGALTGIATHPADEKTAYALFSFAKAPKILRTTDLGQTWTDISGFGSNSTSSNGFPDVATYSLLVMPYNTDMIWAGTEIGIFESKNGGTTWAYADNGFPPAAVWDMAIVNDEVAVATHGRGIWSVRLPELANYEPPAVTLAPRFREIAGGFNGVIAATLSLASAYDSSFVLLDGTKYIHLGANAAAKDTALTVLVPVTMPKTVNLSLLAYRTGKTFQSPETKLLLLPLQQAVTKYSNDFNNLEQGLDDFAADGLELERPSGFANNLINSGHPYGDNRSYTAVLLKPINVAATNATVQYEDIAIVEPGEAGSTFGDPDFYDYVVVEGSDDLGKTWKPLADGYDARDDARWLAAYSANQAGTPAMFKKHEINLLNTFSAGSQILIRFRLFADANTNGWGWAFDNLVIQDKATAVAERSSIPTTFSLEQNYPNPFNPSTTIKYALPKHTEVRLTIFNAFGQKVRTLLDNESKEPGTYAIEWDGRNDDAVPVATGLYFYKLQTKDYVRTLKMLLIK